MAATLAKAGASAVVAFNRFYQPDIDIEALTTVPHLEFSDSRELLLRIRWIAAMFGHVDASLALTGGVHTATDAIKALMAGADVVQLASILLQRGPLYAKTLHAELRTWLEEHDHANLSTLRGCMSLIRCPDPDGFARTNYMRVLRDGGEQARAKALLS